MANEINNISHAGISVVFAPGEEPVIQGAWGFDLVAGFTRQTGLGPGIYTIPLVVPIGGIGPAAIGAPIAEEGAFVLSGMRASGQHLLNVSLTHSVNLGTSPPLNAPFELDLVVFSIRNSNTGAEEDANIGAAAEVRRLPTQD